MGKVGVVVVFGDYLGVSRRREVSGELSFVPNSSLQATSVVSLWGKIAWSTSRRKDIQVRGEAATRLTFIVGYDVGIVFLVEVC